MLHEDDEDTEESEDRVDEEVLFLTLNEDGWEELRPFFSPDALVVSLDLPLMSVPLEIELKVAQFTWPAGGRGVMVDVREPDIEGFESRVKAAGVELPPEESLPGEDQVPETELDAFPGSLIPTACPSCACPQLRIGSLDELERLVRTYAYNNLRGFAFEPCEDHGGHAYVDGELVAVLRCEICMDTFLFGAVVGGLLRYTEEQG